MDRRLFLLALALLAGCSAAPTTPTIPAPVAPPPAVGGPWQSKLDEQNPLVGRIWDPQARAFVSEEVLLERARTADHVLLGEKHDNPDHHRLQARMLQGLADRRPAVVFEMIDLVQQEALDAHLRDHPGDAAGLGAVLSWEKRGWPAWPLYQSIAEVALGAGLRLLAGNISTAQARAVVKEGLGSLGAEQVERWGLTTPLPGPLQVALQEELRRSHCGYLPERILPGMADAQRARDAAMADRMLSVQGPAVLIAGAGHTRTDRGVPWYLRTRRPGVQVVSVAFREVQASQQEPPPPEEASHDLLWFTPRLDDDDPCARIR
ncbi:MAG: ChaN family lipoprotein [Myxococcales bacterium]|nr:ChaN family lipoprotein [Polyangiaceae bacterium]MDW8251116.1 ChaN family lipoprotein [Myxococcales bacterium]